MPGPSNSSPSRTGLPGVVMRIVESPALLALTVGLLGGVFFAFIGARVSPMLGLAAVIGAGVAVYFLRFPTLALYALAFAVPIERFGRITDDTSTFTISVTRGLGLLSLLALVPVLVLRKREPIVNLPLWLWSGFTALGLLTLTYTNDLIPGLRIASGYVGNILVLFTVMNLVRGDTIDETRRRAHIAILYWLAASTAVAAYSIWDWHFGSGRTGGIPVTSLDPQAGAQLAKYRWATVWIDSAEELTLGGLSIRRSMGSTSHAAVFGINLIMSLPFYLYVIARERGKGFLLSGLMWIGLAMTMYCVLLTNTRATLAAAVGVLGLSVMFKLVRITPIMILGGIALALAGPLVLPVDIFERVLDWKNYSTTRSQAMSIRLDYWGAGWRAITDHPLLGNGLGNQRVVLDYLKNPIEGKSHMHNIYLTTLMDVGVLGWMVFLAFLYTSVRACVRARRIFRVMDDIPSYQMMSATLALMIGVLVYGMQVDVFYFPLKAWWLMIGITYVLSRQAESACTTLVHAVPKPADT